MQKRRVILGRGSKLVFTKSKWDGMFVAYTVTDDSREAHDVTHTRSPGGKMEYVPGDFADPGSIDVELRYDVENPPPMGDPEVVQMHVAAEGSTDTVVLQGIGFITSRNFTVPAPGAGAVEGSFTLKKSGEWSQLPAATVDA